MEGKKIRVVIAKIGPDDHYVGMECVAQWLREGGMEVVYLGTNQRVDGVVKAVIEEDADILGLSFHCRGEVEMMNRVITRLREENAGDVKIIVGGVMPHESVSKLKEIGVSIVFLPGSSMTDIVNCVKTLYAEEKEQSFQG